jgi:tRNA threonylcarbamoyladenosine biosynthesis protein TsaB
MGRTCSETGIRVLAIDTSSHQGSVALTDGDCLVGEYLFSGGREYSEKLLVMIDRLLSDAATTMDQIQVVAVSSGPGSFTGLRVGISTAQGLALSREKVLIGIPTLEVVASQAYGYGMQICPMIDSRREEVYTAFFKYTEQGALLKVVDETVIKPAQWLVHCTEPTVFLGSGALLYQGIITAVRKNDALILPAVCGIPRAASVAQLALQRFLEGQRNELESFSPVYIRPPDAEITAGERKGSFLPVLNRE